MCEGVPLLTLMLSLGHFSCCWFSLSNFDVVFFLILAYYIYFVVFRGYLLEVCCFLRRDRKGVNLDGGGRWGGTGRGNCNRDIFSIFNKREK